MNIRPLIGLLGVLLAAMSADLNEFVSLTTLTDLRGALGISYDPGLWIDSLYVSGAAVGMAFAPWNAVTFTLSSLSSLSAWHALQPFSFRSRKTCKRSWSFG